MAIKLDSPGPVIFRQFRKGFNGKQFMMFKFRTMTVQENGPAVVQATRDDPRLTSIGRLLRSASIDELPQLLNVLKGDMSIVGPRPERPSFVAQLTESIPYYGQRHVVKPGLTGWAQIRYTYGATVEDAVQKLQYDLYYIKNLSLTLDLVIVIDTLKILILRRGGR